MLEEQERKRLEEKRKKRWGHQIRLLTLMTFMYYKAAPEYPWILA